jgi:nucleoside 2-deoxyribosyltransferase
VTSLSIAGGIYRERCIQPLWDEVFGSGGRAAAAVVSYVDDVILHAHVPTALRADAEALADRSGFRLVPSTSVDAITFDYLHPLADPHIHPTPARISKQAPLSVRAHVVLRYGLMEGDTVVDAEVAVFDPQSAFGTESFFANGSKAGRLAIVLNRQEARSMVGEEDPQAILKALMRDPRVEAVVLKMGSRGALVGWSGGQEWIPAYRSEHVWKIGSGDVFSAVFAAAWAVRGSDARDAADISSRATAHYCSTRSLPVPLPAELVGAVTQPVGRRTGRVYLAGPFFSLGQRWLVEEAKYQLEAMGVQVFSPVHEVGPGPADVVAPEDLKGLHASDAVFAILDGMDPGTLFEVGYGVKLGLPVVALAENVKAEDLKMLAGTGCEIVDDFTTAVYRAAWALPST